MIGGRVIGFWGDRVMRQLPPPQPPLCHNYYCILCAFCQKNFFFAIKLHKKKIIVVGEIDRFTRLN
ncbi:hypothetical protein N44_00376 [Microcystis aeruginosa NIES-44]|uniref:Uncharacterized protein n=1 Tax=Microcystis aeruginosa NIES-44 TaxID=449439 RepID=A0A0A1VRK9_MICAE|nr:hypothetical protein N44_00376 [Microcystis aeruginosa NIES-44]